MPLNYSKIDYPCVITFSPPARFLPTPLSFVCNSEKDLDAILVDIIRRAHRLGISLTPYSYVEDDSVRVYKSVPEDAKQLFPEMLLAKLERRVVKEDKRMERYDYDRAIYDAYAKIVDLRRARDAVEVKVRNKRGTKRVPAVRVITNSLVNENKNFSLVISSLVKPEK